MYRPQPTNEGELPGKSTAHFIETDSILIDMNLGSMLDGHEHLLATATDDIASANNNSKELMSYEDDEAVECEPARSTQAPIYMLDLSKVGSAHNQYQ